MEKARISSTQLFLLLTGFLLGSTVILNPAIGAKNDAWLALLIGGVLGSLLLGCYVFIALLNLSKTLVEILRDRFGRFAGNAVAILYIWYFIHLASLVFRNFGEFINTATFIETPMAVVIGIFALVLAYAVNSGIEVMARVSELFVPIVPVTILVVSLSLITSHDFTAFLPFLENGISPVLKAAFGYSTFPFGETVVFLMLFPHLNKKENLKKISGFSALFMVVACLFTFFRCISVLGGDLVHRATFSPHMSALLIPGINVEPLVDSSLLISGGTKISVCIYAAVRALCQIAGIDDYRKLTTAVTAFCVILSVWIYRNILEMFNWAENVWPYYSIPFQVGIPLMLLFLSLRKRKKEKLQGHK